jgi:hypothetical protein
MIAILRCQAKNRFYESTQRLIQPRRVLWGAAMSILQAVAAVGGLYLFLHLYLIPKLHRSLPEARSDNAYSAIVGLLVAEVLRGAALVIGASLTIIGATIWAMSYFSGFGSQDDLARIFESLRWTHNLVEEVSTWWGILTVALLSLALWIAIRREARQRVDTGFANAFEKLKADAEDRAPGRGVIERVRQG